MLLLLLSLLMMMLSGRDSAPLRQFVSDPTVAVAPPPRWGSFRAVHLLVRKMKSLLLCGLALAALPALVVAMVPWAEQAREIRSWTGDSQARWRARLDRVLEARMAQTDRNPVELPAAGPVAPLAPGWNSSLATFSGLLPLSSAPGSALFFWLFQPAAPVNASAAPTVLFLNGGPGSSSGLGLFFENGPYRINANLTLSPNPFHWAQQYNLVFLGSFTSRLLLA